MNYEVVKILISILQTNYPETLEKVYVDSPLIFSACWAIIRPWLDPVTQAKVSFVRSSELSNFIEPSVIP